MRRDREHTVSCKRRGPWIPLVGVSQGTKWAGDVAVAVQSGGLTILGEKLDRFVDGRHQAKCGHEWNDVLGPRGWKVSALPRDTVRYHDQYEWRGLPCQRTSAIYLLLHIISTIARCTRHRDHAFSRSGGWEVYRLPTEPTHPTAHIIVQQKHHNNLIRSSC